MRLIISVSAAPLSCSKNRFSACICRSTVRRLTAGRCPAVGTDEVAVQLLDLSHQIGWKEIGGDVRFAQYDLPSPGYRVRDHEPISDPLSFPLDKAMCARNLGVVPLRARLQGRIDRRARNGFVGQLAFERDILRVTPGYFATIGACQDLTSATITAPTFGCVRSVRRHFFLLPRPP